MHYLKEDAKYENSLITGNQAKDQNKYDITVEVPSQQRRSSKQAHRSYHSIYS